MRFIQHPSNNKVLGAPQGWDQNVVECGALPVTTVEIAGQPAMVSYWQPDAEDLKALAAGAKLKLYVFGTGHPPVALEVGN